ncbi:hypothetical protein [Streptomyces sp. NPDC056264]|uniref:hypothetical protein n=1 Tax=Streptomyces sp. NPDC056264 TaxID=3345767 RepID=UPI003AAF0FD2
MGLVAVLVDPAVPEVVEEVLRQTGEGLHPDAVEAEDMIGAHELPAVDGVGDVLDDADAGVGERLEVALALALGEVPGGGSPPPVKAIRPAASAWARTRPNQPHSSGRTW